MLRTGTLLCDRYTIGSMVAAGRGCEGPTYLASHEREQLYLCRDVGPSHSDTAARFHAALSAVQSLSHPNLAPIVHACSHAGREYVVVEAHRGKTLDAILVAAVTPSRRRIHAILHQLCMVLAYVDGQQPAFVFDTLRADDVQVDATGHITLDCYRLGRCFEADAVPMFSSQLEARGRNYALLADLMVDIVDKTHRGSAGRRHDPRFAALEKRLRDFANHPGYTFQEASRSIGSAMGTGILLTGELTTGELYASKTVYTGIDRDGRLHSGTLQSDTLHEAVATLGSAGLRVQDVHFESGQDRLLGRLRKVRRPLAVAFVALCVAGAVYTVRHRAFHPPVPQHARVIVAEADGTLVSINPATLQLSPIGTLTGPVSDVRVLAGGTVLAVVNARSHLLSFVRADNGQPVPVEQPWKEVVDKLLVSPRRDLLYCVGKDSGTIAIMSVHGLQTTLHVSGHIGDVAISPNGKLLYVSIPALNTVDVVDALRGTVLRSFGAAGPSLVGLRNAQQLWVGSTTEVLRMVSLQGSQVGEPSRFTGHMVAFVFPPRGPGYVLCDDGSATPMDGDVQGSSVSADGPGDMAWTLTDRGRLWVSSGRSAELHVLDLGQHGPDQRLPLPSRPVSIDYAP